MYNKIKELLKEKSSEVRKLKIRNRKYDLYVIPSFKEQDLESGIILKRISKYIDLKNLVDYKPPTEGYAARLIIACLNNKKNVYVIMAPKKLKMVQEEINSEFLNTLEKVIAEPTEKNFDLFFS